MKPSEEKSEDKRKESGEKDKNPSSQIPKGKTLFLKILNLFIFTAVEKVLQEKKLNSIENKNDDESKVIQEEFKSGGESSTGKETKFHWK